MASNPRTKMDSSFVGGDKDDQEFQFDHATTDAEVAQEQPREAIKDFGFAKNMRDVLTMDVQGILATDFEELFARDDQDTFGTGFEDIFSRDVKDDQIDRDSAKMDSILAERIKDDKLNRAAIVNKGAQKQPLNAMPAAGNFLQLIPETSGGGDEVSGAGPADAEQLVELRIKSDTMSPSELKDEERELTSILRICIKNTLALTRALTSYPKMIDNPSVQDDMRMVEAMSGFFFVRLSESPECSVVTSAEEELHDTVKTRYIDEIKAMGEQLEQIWRQKLKEAGQPGEGGSA